MYKLDLKLEVKRVSSMQVEELIDIHRLLQYASEAKPTYDRLLLVQTFICLSLNEKIAPDVDYDLIGVAGLSNSGWESSDRFRKLAKRAEYDITGSAMTYPQEMGFLCVHKQYQGRGFSKLLREKAFPLEDARLIDTYTVVREDNVKIRSTNARYGCVQRGKPFKSSRGDYNLVLYTREFTKATPELRKA